MSPSFGVAAIVVGSAAGVAVFAAWERLSLPVALVAMAAAASVVGAGTLIVQDRVTALEWVVTLAVVGLIVPLKAWLLRTRRDP